MTMIRRQKTIATALRGLVASIAVVIPMMTADAQQSGSQAMAHGSQPDAMVEAFTKPLDNDTQRTVRALTLANMLGRHCKGARIDGVALDHFIARSRIRETPNDDIDLALAVVTPDFSYFSHDTLVHLCPKIDALFGPHGMLAPSLLSPGSGGPARPLDPLNPYLPVPMLPHRRGS